MTRSTSRTGLSRATAFLLALALASGWAQSGPVLAYSTVESGSQAALPFLADSRVDTVPVSNTAWLPALHDAREDLQALRAASALAVESKPVSKTAVQPAVTKPAVVKATVTKPTYTGRNHFWIPSLGMSYHVYWYGCSRTRDPANLIYRWGCAGANNVYLLGHAYGVMKPLHDLYVRGGLHKGLVAIYADAAGHVHWYKVVSWRVVLPTAVTWAIASQPTPSMTLQTCMGKNSQYRLNVRLVQFKQT